MLDVSDFRGSVALAGGVVCAVTAGMVMVWFSFRQ